MNELRTYFDSAPRLATKYTNYFDVYSSLLESYRGAKKTIVEIGVADGGSLHMWRRYFGEDARIVGVDFNPNSLALIEDGFEIFIGSQSDPQFLERIFRDIGPIDVLIDDGGHSNLQTLTTLHVAIDAMRDGGTIIFEDTHASYMFLYSNPSRYSFINQARRLVDHLHARSPCVSISAVPAKFRDSVFSIEFFDSVVAFKIDRRLCKPAFYLSNHARGLIDETNLGAASNGSRQLAKIFGALYYRKYPVADAMIKYSLRILRALALHLRARREVHRIKALNVE